MWEGYGDEYLFSYGRATEANLATAQSNATTGVTITPIVFSTEKDTLGVVTSWKQCYKETLMPAMSVSSDQKWDDAKLFIANGGLDFMNEFEQRLMCAGVCEVPLFYTTVDIKEGRPTQDCVNAAVDKL